MARMKVDDGFFDSEDCEFRAVATMYWAYGYDKEEISEALRVDIDYVKWVIDETRPMVTG